MYDNRISSSYIFTKSEQIFYKLMIFPLILYTKKEIKCFLENFVIQEIKIDFPSTSINLQRCGKRCFSVRVFSICWKQGIKRGILEPWREGVGTICIEESHTHPHLLRLRLYSRIATNFVLILAFKSAHFPWFCSFPLTVSYVVFVLMQLHSHCRTHLYPHTC